MLLVLIGVIILLHFHYHLASATGETLAAVLTFGDASSSSSSSNVDDNINNKKPPGGGGGADSSRSVEKRLFVKTKFKKPMAATKNNNGDGGGGDGDNSFYYQYYYYYYPDGDDANNNNNKNHQPPPPPPSLLLNNQTSSSSSLSAAAETKDDSANNNKQRHRPKQNTDNFTAWKPPFLLNNGSFYHWSGGGGGSELSAEQLLQVRLFGPKSKYLKQLRPVKRHDKVVEVEVGLSVVMIEELIERDQLMVMAAALKLRWIDDFLSWDPESYDNLTWTTISSDDIWIPDVAIVNGLDPSELTHKFSLVDVDYMGEVGYFPSGRLITRCRVHIAYFPFDLQHCEVLLESSIYPTTAMQFIAYEDGDMVDIKDYYSNHQWELIGYDVKIQDVTYLSRNFSQISFSFVLQRKSLYYFMYFIFPELLAACLQTLSYSLPVEHPGRMTMLTSLFIGTSVTSVSVANAIPKSSDSTSLLQIYMTILLVNLVLCLVVTTIILYTVWRYPDDDPSLKAMFKALFTIVWPKTSDKEHHHHHHHHDCEDDGGEARSHDNSAGSSDVSRRRLLATTLICNVCHSYCYDDDDDNGNNNNNNDDNNAARADNNADDDDDDDNVEEMPTAGDLAYRQRLQRLTYSSPHLHHPPHHHRHQRDTRSGGIHLSSASVLRSTDWKIATINYPTSPFAAGSSVKSTAAANNNDGKRRLDSIHYHKQQRASIVSNSSRISKSSSCDPALSHSESREELKKLWLHYCVALDKTIMYANGIWNIALPIVLFALVPILSSQNESHE